MLRFPLLSALIILLTNCLTANAQYVTDTDIPFTAKADTYSCERLRLDIHHPSDTSARLPVIVWFHGGGLTGGSKEIPVGLRQKGYVVVAPAYRLIPKVDVEQCIDDAAEAVAWVMRNICSYGGDPGKIVVAGHSAGGYLTSMLGLDKRWLASYGVDADSLKALVPYSGQVITHFSDRAAKGIGALTPYVDEHAPLFHVRNDCAPYIIITGDAETELYGRYEENLYMWRMMKLSGHPHVSIYKIDGHDHGAMVDPAHHILLSILPEFLK